MNTKKPTKTSSEWDLCPKCDLPWAYHCWNGKKDNHAIVFCPNQPPKDVIFQWKTKKKK